MKREPQHKPMNAMNDETKPMKSTTAIQCVKDALGTSAGHFDIEYGETLVDDDDYTSITIAIMPKPENVDGGNIIGGKHYIQVDIDDTGVEQMVFGEDTLADITAGNIYRYLYWCEVCKPD